MAIQISAIQKRIYDKAVLAHAYTIAECDELANDMPDQEDGYFHVDGSGGVQPHYDAIKGLWKAGYFTSALVTYGDADVLADWTLTKVASPPDDWPILTDVIPFPSGADAPTGVDA